MHVLITGAAGFIGSHLADALLADGHEVYGIDNLLTGHERNIADGVKFWEGDITGDATDDFWNALTLSFADCEPKVVVHAAASYNDPANIERDALTNVYGTARVVRECEAYDVSRLVYLQTSLCYGLKPPPYPMSVTQPLDPHGSYATSKTAGEWIVRDSGLDYISFRLANIYGPRNLSGPVPTFYKRLKAGESCTIADTRRDFVYIDDAVEVFKRAVYGEGETGVYHVSTGGDYPIETLAAHVEFAMRQRSVWNRMPRGADDTATLLLDPTKTLEHFPGWYAGTEFADGIAKAVAWYDEHGVGDTFTHLRTGT